MNPKVSECNECSSLKCWIITMLNMCKYDKNFISREAIVEDKKGNIGQRKRFNIILFIEYVPQ